MLTWFGRHGDFVRFEIMGYEQPEATDDHDSNWVRVGVVVQNEQGAWSRNCGCMTTTDIRFFAQWFTKVVDGIVDDMMMSYEPDLKIQYLIMSEGLHWFGICLRYGLGYVSPTSENNASLIVVALSEVERQQAISYFTDMEARYSRRGRLQHQPPLDLPEIDELP
ncbi:MAG TPA: hypothetical protein VFT66_02590 [Roseiflexaceae bacterium]|jgi:hypothetical protein|nr:hypothetical protein [Roseiflexaceae bacterium]